MRKIIIILALYLGLVANNASAQIEDAINWKSVFVLSVIPDLSEREQLDTLNVLRKLGNDLGESDIDALYYNALGVYYFQVSVYPKMLQNVLKALEINKKSGNNRLLSMNYNMLSLYFQEVGRPEKALEPQIKALELAKELGEEHLTHFYSSNLAAIYIDLEQYELSLPVQQENLTHYIEKKDTNNICSELYNLAYANFKIGDSTQALKYLINIESYYNNNPVQWEIEVLALTLKGIILQGRKKYYEAQEAYLLAYENAIRIQSLSTLSSISENLQKMYEEKGDFANALKWLKNFKTYSDSIVNEQTLNNLNELEVKYESDLREQELAAAEAQLESLNKQNILNVVVFSFSIVLILLLAWVYYNKMKIKEKEVTISHKKIDELIAKQELESLQITLQAKEQERHRIARDLHDHLSSKMAALKLNFSYWKNKFTTDDESSNSMAQIIQELADDVRRISHDLSSDVKGKISLVQLLQNLQKQIHVQNQIQCKVTCFGQLEGLPSALENNIYRIVQELVSNTLKHAKAKQINISLTQIRDEINLVYDDDGKGFDLAKTSVNPGIGLNNIRSRVKDCNANLQFDTAPGSGFNTVIVFPIPQNVQV